MMVGNKLLFNQQIVYNSVPNKYYSYWKQLLN